MATVFGSVRSSTPAMVHRIANLIGCLLCFPLLAQRANASAVHPYTVEYVAMVPNRQGPTHPLDYDVDWVELRYPAQESVSLEQVTLRRLGSNEGHEVLGNWRNVSLKPSGAMLTGRLHEDNFYVLLNLGQGISWHGGCCADTLRIFPRWGSGYRDVDLIQPIKFAFQSARHGYQLGVSHSFTIGYLNSELHFWSPTLYREPRLSNIIVDAIVAISIETGRLHLTADGHRMFSTFDRLSTLKTDRESSVWKVQYADQFRPNGEQFHVNGLHRFTALDGTVVLAVAQKMDVEVLLLKCPFTYTSAEGGGSILQRFGSPPIIKDKQVVGHHNFGVRDDNYWPLKYGHPKQLIRAQGGVHNIYHKRYSAARETLTVFVNQVSVTDKNVSGVYEFDVKLLHSQSISKDEVFNTSYKQVILDFASLAQGGARPIRNDIWIVASGLAGIGYEVIDSKGHRLRQSYVEDHCLLYDPFVFVNVGTSYLLVQYLPRNAAVCIGGFAALLILLASCSWFAIQFARANRTAIDLSDSYIKV